MWRQTNDKGPQIAREETHCRHMGCSFRIAAMVLLYASSHRQDNTYHDLCYTSRGALAGTRNTFVSRVIPVLDIWLHRSCMLDMDSILGVRSSSLVEHTLTV